MATFQKVKLGGVITKIIGGGTPSKSNSDYWNGSLPWASVKDLSDNKYYLDSTQDSITEDGLKNSASNLIKKDTVILPTRMGLGRVVKTRIDTTINQDLKAIIPNEKINNDFLLWSLVNSGQTLRSLGNGSTVSGIRLEELKNIEIDLPDFPTQTRIASVLSAYDDLIENNEKRIKVLEEMAQLLYTEWFVKFTVPAEVLTKAGISGGKVKMVESKTEYGKIPEGWEVKKLGEVASIVRGCSYSSEEIDDFVGDYYIVNLKSFNRGGGFRFDGAKYFSGSINDNQSLKTGDIVVAVTDMTNDRAVIARPARVPEIDGKITFSADVVKINSNVLPRSYIYQLLSSYRFTQTTKHKANGANVLHLKPAAILEFVALIPDAQSLKEFDVLCEPVAREIDKLLKQNDNLSKTRDLLIPQLVTGKRELK